MFKKLYPTNTDAIERLHSTAMAVVAQWDTARLAWRVTPTALVCEVSVAKTEWMARYKKTP